VQQVEGAVIDAAQELRPLRACAAPVPDGAHRGKAAGDRRSQVRLL
jgi:hypothetical protein